MAVFPDRIVLKNSTDSQAAIESAIGSGGTDEISQGEVVIGLTTGAAALYTKDAVGTIVTLSGKVASVNSQIDDVIIDVENLGNFQYGVDPAKQSFVLSGPSNNTPSASGMWDIGSNFNNYFAWYDTDPIQSWLSTVPVGTAIEFVTRWGYKHTAVTSTVASTYASGADYISFSGYPWPQELLDAQANNEFIVVQEQNAFLTPQDGEALLYEASTGLWRPASTSGSVSSVNGLTGAVSIGVEDLDDYLPQPGTHPVAYHSDKQSDGNWSGSNSSTTGGYALDQSGGNYTGIYINKNTPTSGTSLASQGFTAGTTLDLWVSADGVNFTQHTATNSYAQSVNNALFTGLSPNLNAYTSASALYFSLSAPGAAAPLADGDILQYESATSAWRPVPSTGLGGSVASIDDIGDVDTTTVAPTDGQALVWDNTAQQWEPGSVAASAGRGDGGDFDTGTVDSAYVFGVYGGGDFSAGSASTTAVAPFAHAYIDSNNISSTTAHTGMSSAAHVYIASTDSYIDFTFDTAQPGTDYSVLHSGEAGWNVLEVENKTTSGFRVSFYDEATGNVLSTGAVGIGAPVITVYDSDPTITVSSSSGVDLPAELFGDDEGPDGGSF